MEEPQPLLLKPFPSNNFRNKKECDCRVVGRRVVRVCLGYLLFVVRKGMKISFGKWYVVVYVKFIYFVKNLKKEITVESYKISCRGRRGGDVYVVDICICIQEYVFELLQSAYLILLYYLNIIDINYIELVVCIFCIVLFISSYMIVLRVKGVNE